MITINGNNYDIIKDIRDAYDNEVVTEKLTDYFENFDYIVGDWAYGKLRLKGFNDKTNKNYKDINDYQKIDSYIDTCCAYGCRYFILKKIENK